MPVAPNRYYNDPALGQAFANLADAFAPPSGSDASGYATAAATKQAASQLAWLFNNSADPTASKRAAVTGVQEFGNTPEGYTYNVDTNASTLRRGQDVQAATDITNNQNTVRGSTLGDLYGALSEGQVRPAVPAELAATIGLPAVPAATGAPKPLSADEVKAGQLQWLFENANDPTAATRSAVVGVQGYGDTQPGFAQTNETTRRGDELQAVVDLYKSLGPGEVRPAIPANIAAHVGLPEIAAAAGLDKPLSETEWDAAQKQRLQASGLLSDQTILDAIVGAQTPVKAADGVGNPIYMSPGEAVRTKAQPLGTESNSDAADNYLAVGPDGKELRFVGYVGSDNKIHDRATGQVVPNVIRREGTGGGMSFEVGKDGTIKFATGVGGNTVSRTTDLQTQAGENDRGAQELISLYDALRQDDLGVLGNVNESVLTDFGAQFNPDLARPDVVARRNQLRASSANLAKAIMQDGKLSDTDRQLAKEIAVTDGIDVSLPGAQAQLAQLAVLLRWQEAAAKAQLAGGAAPARDAAFVGSLVDQGLLPAYMAKKYIETMASSAAPQAQPVGAQMAPPPALPPAAPVSAPVPAAPAAPVQVASPEEARALPPGTLFQTPDGRIKTRP